MQKRHSTKLCRIIPWIQTSRSIYAGGYIEFPGNIQQTAEVWNKESFIILVCRDRLLREPDLGLVVQRRIGADIHITLKLDAIRRVEVENDNRDLRSIISGVTIEI